MSISPLCLALDLSFNLDGYDRLFLLHVTKPYLRVNFLDLDLDLILC